MRRFIELTSREDGARMLVNVRHIVHVSQRSTGTRVHLVDDAFIDVRESLDEVRQRVEEGPAE